MAFLGSLDIAARSSFSAAGRSVMPSRVAPRLLWAGPKFFFQAEDGIRDFKTGVQTCALPIWVPISFSPVCLCLSIIFCSCYLFCDLVSDRKSTRLNSSHLVISYAVFCLK